MVPKNLLPTILTIAVLISCGSNHLIEDNSYRKAVLKDFIVRGEQYGERRQDLFSSAARETDPRKREALQFMVAYMPLSDLALYEPDFLEANVDLALRTRDEMQWGASIPYELFLHFVLPQRVNNENIDSFRLFFYDELKARVAGLGAAEAALEINHWCHEKVAYQPSDIRTSAPLATILSARGRCGEESTFTVSALRTAGLPARQVYTPRWAHSDDNHAWVEVWIEGSWYYMGACEPEPVLDRGWFTQPAARAMLTHTKAFGRYEGDEMLVKREPLFSEINTLGKYALTKQLSVFVTDTSGIPMPDAIVDFLLYNYAELFPIASVTTDKKGESIFTTGKGSLVVWAHINGKYGLQEVPPDADTVTVIVSAEHTWNNQSLDLFAPESDIIPSAPPEELMRENAYRLAREDSIRQSYVNSWMENVSAGKISKETGIDSVAIQKVLKTSMGNYLNIVTFLRRSIDDPVMAMRLLETLTEKDLRDTPADILMDHITSAPENSGGLEAAFYDQWVLSPRIDNEILSRFRSDLTSAFSEEMMNKFKGDPLEIACWIDSAVTVDDSGNYYGTPLNPRGVERLRASDHHSRDIFFVALCRTAGHPARIEQATGRPQYFLDNKWNDVWFSDDKRPAEGKGFVTFTSSETNPQPEYRIHFTLARLENGRYQTLEFGENTRINDLPVNIPLSPGSYMLVTGNRNDKGNVLADLFFFELEPDDSVSLEVRLRHIRKDKMISGVINAGQKITLLNEKKISLSSIMDKGIIVIWIEQGTEPTRHIFGDLPKLKKEFDDWGGYLLFMLYRGSDPVTIDTASIEGLPENTLFCMDDDHQFLKSASKTDYAALRLPVVIYADNLGKILFSSEGYRIGIGEQILKTIQ